MLRLRRCGPDPPRRRGCAAQAYKDALDRGPAAYQDGPDGPAAQAAGEPSAGVVGDGGGVRLFSRKATDYTALYSPLFRDVMARGHIRARTAPTYAH